MIRNWYITLSVTDIVR